MAIAKDRLALKMTTKTFRPIFCMLPVPVLNLSQQDILHFCTYMTGQTSSVRYPRALRGRFRVVGDHSGIFRPHHETLERSQRTAQQQDKAAKEN